MSRGSSLKFSANMALGGAEYRNVDIEHIRSSLRLLKSKRNRQQPMYDEKFSSYELSEASAPFTKGTHEMEHS
jgi:hypothetical protein